MKKLLLFLLISGGSKASKKAKNDKKWPKMSQK